MQRSQIEKVIAAMNQEFEYHFEDYTDVDQCEIWWIYDSKKNCVTHITNRCQKQGDLAIHYYQKGFCPIYAQILKRLFPEGVICHSISHMIFYYQDHYYDASGEIEINPLDFIVTPENFNYQTFSQYYLSSEGNIILANKMYQKGLQILFDSPSLQKRKENL